MEEPGNLFICSLLLYIVFPFSLCMLFIIYALPLVHYQCAQIMLQGARDLDHSCSINLHLPKDRLDVLI